jgi:hypothetical protein
MRKAPIPEIEIVESEIEATRRNSTRQLVHSALSFATTRATEGWAATG